MREAVIVAVARTPIGRAYRGAFNDTDAPTLAAFALRVAVERAGVEPGEVDDVVLGCAMQEGSQRQNIGRAAAMAAGFPASVAGAAIDRQCASGLSAVAAAAAEVVVDGAGVVVAGGVESLSLVQNEHINRFRSLDPSVLAHQPDFYLPMIDTAEILAARYGIGREAADAYALQSQQRMAAAQEAGVFADEIVPVTVSKTVTDRETAETSSEEVTLRLDECNRPATTLERLAALEPVRGPGGVVTAGNASPLSDGAAGLVVMEAAEAERRGLEPLGFYRGTVTVGVDPAEMGTGPVHAVPKLLSRAGLGIDDIGLWELNEAFGVQTVYCRDALGIDNDIFNVNGGAISIGHPYGVSGVRMVGHALLEGRRRGVRYAVATMCVGYGMGVATLLEII